MQPATANEAWGFRVVAGSPLVVEGLQKERTDVHTSRPRGYTGVLEALVEGFRDGSHLEEPDTSYGLYAIGHEGES